MAKGALLGFLALAVLWCRGLSTDAGRASKPNVVILFADDVRKHVLARNNGEFEFCVTESSGADLAKKKEQLQADLSLFICVLVANWCNLVPRPVLYLALYTTASMHWTWIRLRLVHTSTYNKWRPGMLKRSRSGISKAY